MRDLAWEQMPQHMPEHLLPACPEQMLGVYSAQLQLGLQSICQKTHQNKCQFSYIVICSSIVLFWQAAITSVAWTSPMLGNRGTNSSTPKKTIAPKGPKWSNFAWTFHCCAYGRSKFACKAMKRQFLERDWNDIKRQTVVEFHWANSWCPGYVGTRKAWRQSICENTRQAERH